MEDIEHYSIRIYNFPYDVEEDDEDTIEENSELRVSCVEGMSVRPSVCKCVVLIIMLLNRLFCPFLSLAVMKRSL